MGIRGHRSSRLVFRNKDHKEVHAVKYNPTGSMAITYPPNYPRNPIEKMYIENDECDGLVWEKTHDQQIIVPCMLYNGPASTKGEPTPLIIHPKEPYVSYTYKKIGQTHNIDITRLLYNNGSKSVRTKDFGIILSSVNTSGNLERPQICVSKDGVEWHSPQDIICSNHELFGWGTDDNVGIGFCEPRRYIDGAYHENSWLKYELDSTGKLKTSYITSFAQPAQFFTTVAGKIAIIAEETNGDAWYFKILNTDGEIYNPAFSNPGQYAYHAKTFDLQYWNGKYYLFRVIGPNANQSFEIIESEDGFKTISKRNILDNDIFPSMFRILGELKYYNEKLWLFVKGFIVRGNPGYGDKYYYGDYEPFFYIYEFDKEDISKTPTTHIGPHYMDFDFIGCNSSRKLTLMFDDSLPPHLSDYTRAVDGFNDLYVGYPKIVFPGLQSIGDNETIRTIVMNNNEQRYICCYGSDYDVTSKVLARECQGPHSTHYPDRRNEPFNMLYSADGWPNREVRQWWKYETERGNTLPRPTAFDDVGIMTSLYFKDGVPVDPYDFMCFGCRREINGLTGLGEYFIMIIEGDLTTTPKSKYAFSSRNFMIDHYNETWRY